MAGSFHPALHAFRGFAILNITAIHVFSWPFYIIRERGYEVASGFGLIDATVGILFHDSTLYFTFISGLLFAVVLRHRGYSAFFRSKFSYVFLPFLVFTLFATSLQWTESGFPPFYMRIESMPEYLGKVTLNLLTGNALWIYWYIPVLMVLYALTPLLDKLPTFPGGWWLCGLIILAPLVCSRVWPAVSWTNYVYFLGAYLLGMLVGKHYQQSMDFIERNRGTFALVAVVTTALFFLPIDDNYKSLGFTNLNESIWYVQKIALAGLVLLWLERTLETVPGWLDLLANYAFALYFVHMFVAAMYFALLDAGNIHFDNSTTILINLLLSYPLVMACCIALIFLIKKLLGRYSRYVIGS